MTETTLTPAAAETPAVVTPQAAPAAVEVAAPVIAPAAPGLAPPEVAPAAPAPVAPAEKSLLSAEPLKEDKKEIPPAASEAQKAEEGKAPETKKEEGSQSDEPAPLPTYEAFTLPEGITHDDGKLGEFTKELAAFELLTKADHAKMQEFGQTLVNRHVAEQQALALKITEHYQNAWQKQGDDWKDAFEKDPEIGLNRRDTTLNAAQEFIRTHGGTEDQQNEFRQLMDTTKIGNHPALIRLLARANTALSEGKPLAAPKPPLTTTSKVERRYGKTS